MKALVVLNAMTIDGVKLMYYADAVNKDNDNHINNCHEDACRQ